MIGKSAFKFSRVVSKGKYLPELDGLRFIAIISVLIFHTNNALNSVLPAYSNPLTNYFKSGFLGVEIFFAISGYILSRQLLNGGPINLSIYKNYIMRRVKRIEPPFVISTVAIYLMWVFFGSESIEALTRSFLAVITYTSNFFDNNIINVVTWSLEVEVQFYLILPLVLLLYSGKNVYRLMAGLILLILTGFLFYWNQWIPVKTMLMDLHWFCCGIIIALMQSRGIVFRTYFKGLNLILILLSFLLAQYYSPLNSVLIWVALLILFNNVLILRKGIGILGSPVISIIGGMCYTIYLFHYPIMSIFFRNVFPHIRNLGLPTEVLYWTALLLTTVIQLVISAWLFRAFERPFMDPNWTNNFRVWMRTRLATGKVKEG